MKLSDKVKVGAAALAGSGIAASGATALTSTFTVSIEFFDPFSIVETTPADFGRLISGVATTYSMAALGGITSGPGGSTTGGTPASGNYQISDASTGGNIIVTVDNPVADGGVTITAFDCNFSAGGALDNGATCSLATGNPDSAGEPLLIGFDINVDGTQNSLDTANPTFDITVAYQ